MKENKEMTTTVTSTKETLMKDVSETIAAARDLGMNDYADQLQVQLDEYGYLTEEEAERAYAFYKEAKEKPLTHGFFNGHVVKADSTAKKWATRYRYKLRGFDDLYLHVGSESRAGSATVLSILVDILEGIEKNRMINFEYTYTRFTDIVPMRPLTQYNNVSPVIALSVEVRRFKFGEQVIIKLFEACGRSEYVQFDSTYAGIREVVKGFRTAIKRLEK